MIYRLNLKFIYCVFLFFFLFTDKKAQAQKFYEGVLYPYNSYYLNPAFAGSENNTVLLLNYRSLGAHIMGLPKQLMFGIHAPIYKNMGLGLRLENYSEGLFNFFSGLIDYSYYVAINQKQSLSFGVSIGYAVNSLDNSKIVAKDPMAIIEAASEHFIGIKFINSFGFVYRYQKLDISISSPRLFISDYGLSPSFTGFVNYRFNLLDNQITMKPFIYTLYNKDLPLVYDFMLITDFKNTFQFGIGYRSSNALILSMGLNFSGFQINYAADLSVGKTAELFNVFNEVSIAYEINKEKKVLTDSLFNPPIIVKIDSVKSEHIVSDTLHTPVFNDRIKILLKDSVQLNIDSSKIDDKTVLSTDDIDENTAFNELDSIIAEMDIPENDVVETEVLDESYFDQYFTILIDLKKSADAANRNIELLENIDVRKDKSGNIYYLYGQYFTKDEAEKSATLLKSKGFKIIKISQIGKL